MGLNILENKENEACGCSLARAAGALLCTRTQGATVWAQHVLHGVCVPGAEGEENEGFHGGNARAARCTKAKNERFWAGRSNVPYLSCPLQRCGGGGPPFSGQAL